MPIPDYQTLMLPYLDVLADGSEHKLRDIIEKLSDKFELTTEERQTLLPSGNQEVIVNRVGWTRTHLKKAGLIEVPKRGFSKLTLRGKEALESQLDRIDTRYLKQFPEYIAFINLSHKTSDTNSSGDDATQASTSNKTPIEAIEQAHQELNSELASDLLQTIKDQSPQFFEKLVVDLMQAMGYGGWSKDSGKVTQYNNDAGVDGLINEDPLGLETIYLQAKRYTENAIGRPDIQAFVGALEMKRARKGVFITASRFSRDAQEYINMIEKRVILIDGEQLANLMIQYGLGVSVKATYRINTLDTDYFAED